VTNSPLIDSNMPSPPESRLKRTLTWPPSTHAAMDHTAAHEFQPGSKSSATEHEPAYDFDKLKDLDEHPEDHFLSPLYQHEDWASDSDDDGEEIEWDAGITDFALFDSDRRRAQESDKELDRRWDTFMSTQQSALRRAVRRSQTEPLVDTTRPPLPVEDMPALTPDTSPNLRDDLDVDSYDSQDGSTRSVPSYLTVTITPPSPKDRTIDDNDDLPLSFCIDYGKQRARKLQRPGLRHARTLSGKAHVWRRPSWNIYTVGEDPDLERRAEQGMIRRRDGHDDLRGRRPSGGG